MKTTSIIAIAVLLHASCFSQNLISNGNFQFQDMAPRCDGWFDACGDELTAHCDTVMTCYVSLYPENPSLIPEDIWGLRIKTGFPEEPYAETYVTGQSGTYEYELNFWMRATDWFGGARLGVTSGGQFVEHASVVDTADFWKLFTLTETLTTEATDTITVRLTAGTGDLCVCPPVKFAFIQLTASIVNSTDDLHKGRLTHKTYPNPARDHVTVAFYQNRLVNAEARVYDVSGRLVLTERFDGRSVRIDRGALEAGIYFYEILSEGEGAAAGKILFE